MTVAYALLYTGLRTTSSGTAVVATLVEPVTAVLIAVLLLDEHLSAVGLVGALLSRSAAQVVPIARRRRARHRPRHAGARRDSGRDLGLTLAHRCRTPPCYTAGMTPEDAYEWYPPPERVGILELSVDQPRRDVHDLDHRRR